MLSPNYATKVSAYQAQKLTQFAQPTIVLSSTGTHYLVYRCISNWTIPAHSQSHHSQLVKKPISGREFQQLSSIQIHHKYMKSAYGYYSKHDLNKPIQPQKIQFLQKKEETDETIDKCNQSETSSGSDAADNKFCGFHHISDVLLLNLWFLPHRLRIPLN